MLLPVLIPSLIEHSASDEDNMIESFSLGQYPAPRPRGRSQTAPMPPSAESHSQFSRKPRLQPLRREQTSPGPSRTPLAAPLDALKEAYAALAKAEALADDYSGNGDDFDVEEIMQARQLTHQISAVLDERIVKKREG